MSERDFDHLRDLYEGRVEGPPEFVSQLDTHWHMRRRDIPTDTDVIIIVANGNKVSAYASKDTDHMRALGLLDFVKKNAVVGA